MREWVEVDPSGIWGLQERGMFLASIVYHEQGGWEWSLSVGNSLGFEATLDKAMKAVEAAIERT